ncbi:MAG: DNA alkylation repair protein [Victivallaceae bacterium]
MNAVTLEQTLHAAARPERVPAVERFFKTGKGEYGEGDRFLGLDMPTVRAIVREFRALPLSEVTLLLKNPYHEVRLTALLILADQFRHGDLAVREVIFQIYRKHTWFINNWDLVDATAPGIVGEYARTVDPAVIGKFAASGFLWEERIALLATLTLIRHGEFEPTLQLVRRFLDHRHDLIHKAAGWMLREIGKRDRAALTAFLSLHKDRMPRTMLRYAIEHYSPQERRILMTKAGSAGRKKAAVREKKKK